MSNNHYDLSGTLQGIELVNSLKTLALAWDQFTRLRGVLVQRKDTSASGDAVFAEIAVTYGYEGVDDAEKQAKAAASFSEIDTAFSTANASITQMLNRHI